MFKDS